MNWTEQFNLYEAFREIAETIEPSSGRELDDHDLEMLRRLAYDARRILGAKPT